jgi:hypothetical protein
MSLRSGSRRWIIQGRAVPGNDAGSVAETGRREVKHYCHADGCGVEVPPRLLMCLRHWRMVPGHLQRLVWRHYRPGQEIDKNPTRQYLAVMKQAIEAVAEQEGPRLPLVG